MTNYSIRDNHQYGNVGDFLKEIVRSNSNVSIVSAYFTIYAYHHLKTELDGIENLRFLFGEPTFIKSVDPSKKNHRSFKIEDDQLIIPIEQRLTQKSIAAACSNWIQKKVDIRSMVKPNFLHGKMYHVVQESGIEKAIVGSSNFTVNGLGLGGNNNIELNMIIDSDRGRQELKQWFDGIWNDTSGLVEDVKDDVIKYLAQLYAENEPEFIYFKTLYHVFENYLEDQAKGGLLNEKTGFFESEVWNSLYNFQKDGVKGAINKILKLNGCIIADSVGLGKTYEALAVIKYFELLNNRVLVLCPKKLTGNWTIYQASQNHALNPFVKDRFNYSVLYHTDLGRVAGKSDANGIDLDNFNWGAYDLIVIDESHNFKGNPFEKSKDDGTTKMNRAKWLMEKIIKSGVKTRVLMLSATPVNNTLRDLRNQIALITEGRDDALLEISGIKDISLTLKTAQTHFTTWADHRKNPRRNLKDLLERLDSAFFKLLDELTIARSRKHIKSFYKLESIGSFPERLKPYSVYPVIDLKNRFPTYDRLNKQILEYKLSIFNPSAYVLDEKKPKYEELAGTEVLAFKQSDRENFLIGMMKVNYLKRLESSIESFEISLDRTIRKIEDLEKKITAFMSNKTVTQEQTLEDAQPAEEELEEDGEDIEQWQVGKKLRFDLADLKLKEWLVDLSKDKAALIDLYNNATAVTPDRDAKLHELKKIIETKIKNPTNDGNKKIVIFTAFADTAQYIYDNLSKWIKDDLDLNSALVSGSHTQTTFGKNDYDSILTNFSPLSKNRSKMKTAPQQGEIDILVATDCISEGQNLQDCDLLVNYDIHWNPVRIIQRFGRIDRIHSAGRAVQLVNFWPTEDLNKYINLKNRVEARMALVDIAATFEDNILANKEIEDIVSEDLRYRDKQLLRLKDEILDIEDMGDNVSLTEFTLDDFRLELLKYIEANRDTLESAPLGLYTCVPPRPEHKIIAPGVIFCFRQEGPREADSGAKPDAGASINPLQPYFLVYVLADGNVRYGFAHPKQILDIYRALCSGKSQPCTALCNLFDQQTNHGRDMKDYDILLDKAVASLAATFRKRAASGLTSSRSFILPDEREQVHEKTDLELVTWLVIKKGNA